jgi:hypothetical protein
MIQVDETVKVECMNPDCPMFGDSALSYAFHPVYAATAIHRSSYYVVHRERTEAICYIEWQIWCSSYRVSAWGVEE